MTRLDYFVPALGKGAEMLTGSQEEIIDRLIELMKAKEGCRLMAASSLTSRTRPALPTIPRSRLIAAAKKIDAAASPTPSSRGWGASSMRSANPCAPATARCGKSRMRRSAYPNAELIRQALVKVLPAAAFCWFRMITSASICPRDFRSS